MKVNTLFPSKSVEGETKDGIVILKLKKISPSGVLKLRVSFENRLGEPDSDEAVIEIGDRQGDYYQNTGIRKGILLSRYAGLMKNWMYDERVSYENSLPIEPKVTEELGIVVPDEDIEFELGIWERQSIPLQVSGEYKQLFTDFNYYFKSEMDKIGDTSLSQEVDILTKLSN